VVLYGCVGGCLVCGLGVGGGGEGGFNLSTCCDFVDFFDI